MHHFSYKSGELFAEGVGLTRIIEAVGTPVYVYSAATIRRHVQVLQQAFAHSNVLIAYSVKANANLAVLKLLSDMGCGADIVSIGEMRRAMHAGIPANKIVFSGVGKTRAEMAEALRAGIHTFNVESRPELQLLNAVAKDLGTIAPVALRVNPNVAAGGHANISTGKAGDKFGISWANAPEVASLAATLDYIDLVGLDVHIGSQITDIEPMRVAFGLLMELTRALNDSGHKIRQLDFGGGLGIPYSQDDSPDSPDAYARMVAKVMANFDGQVILEPGRVIMGNAGILLAEVVYVKSAEDRQFAILDAGMNDLMRPALYDAHHDIWPIIEGNSAQQAYDVVGPVCESTDVFARNVSLPQLKSGHRLAFMSAGAYGAVLASQYNARPLVPEVLVDGEKFAIVRRRPTFSDMINLEETPNWMD